MLDWGLCSSEPWWMCSYGLSTVWQAEASWSHPNLGLSFKADGFGCGGTSSHWGRRGGLT